MSTAALSNSRELFEELGMKQIEPPKTMGSHHLLPNGNFTDERTTLLIAVVYGQFGESLKEIRDNYMLHCVREGPNAADYYELTKDQIAQLNERLKQPQGASA